MAHTCNVSWFSSKTYSCSPMGATILSLWAAAYGQGHPRGQKHFAMLCFLSSQVTPACFSLSCWDHFSVWFALATVSAEHQMALDRFDKLEMNACPLESNLWSASSFILSSLSLSTYLVFIRHFHHQVSQLLLWFLVWWAIDNFRFFSPLQDYTLPEWKQR